MNSRNKNFAVLKASVVSTVLMLVINGGYGLLRSYLDSVSHGAISCFIPCHDYQDNHEAVINTFLTYFVALPTLLVTGFIVWLTPFIIVVLSLMLLYGLIGFLPTEKPLGNLPPDDSGN